MFWVFWVINAYKYMYLFETATL